MSRQANSMGKGSDLGGAFEDSELLGESRGKIGSFARPSF